jgi:hypothetical protein
VWVAAINSPVLVVEYQTNACMGSFIRQNEILMERRLAVVSSSTPHFGEHEHPKTKNPGYFSKTLVLRELTDTLIPRRLMAFQTLELRGVRLLHLVFLPWSVATHAAGITRHPFVDIIGRHARIFLSRKCVNQQNADDHSNKNNKAQSAFHGKILSQVVLFQRTRITGKSRLLLEIV